MTRVPPRAAADCALSRVIAALSALRASTALRRSRTRRLPPQLNTPKNKMAACVTFVSLHTHRSIPAPTWTLGSWRPRPCSGVCALRIRRQEGKRVSLPRPALRWRAHMGAGGLPCARSSDAGSCASITERWPCEGMQRLSWEGVAGACAALSVRLPRLGVAPSCHGVGRPGPNMGIAKV